MHPFPCDSNDHMNQPRGDCETCRHMKNDDGESDVWRYCARPNYPPGLWNMLIEVQRKPNNPAMCGGRHWAPLTGRGVDTLKKLD